MGEKVEDEKQEQARVHTYLYLNRSWKNVPSDGSLIQMEPKPTVVVTQQPAQQANVVVVQPVQSVRPLPQQWSTGFCNGPCCLGCIIPCMGLYYAISNGPKERFYLE